LQQNGPELLTPLPPVTDPLDPGATPQVPLGAAAESPQIGLTPSTKWSFQADALALQRGSGSSAYLGQTSVGIGGPVVGTLNANDVGYSMQPGARLALLCNIDDQLQWETLYFGLQNWSASNTLLANPYTGVLASSPYTQVDKLIGGFGQSLGYTYNSRLENIEFNARRRYLRGPFTISPLIGLRYFQWNEGLNLAGSDQFFGVTENVTSKAGNYMFGLQGGGDLRWTWKQLSLDMTGKAGIFANFISIRQANTNSIGIAGIPGAAGFVTSDTSSTTLGAAGVFDFSATASYRLGQHFELRGGYQCLYVTGLALAPDQFGGGAISHHADMFLHGPMAGLQANW
jgi:hypothetical protein